MLEQPEAIDQQTGTGRSPGTGRNVLIIVENLPVPFDRRVWLEATTLVDAGHQVSVICPTGKGYEALYEVLDGVHIYRHPLPQEVSSAVGYLREYACALWHEWTLARRVRRERGFDVLHACNPPDLIFIVAAWFKLFHGTRFIFDHHDLNPELYESKFGKRGVFHRLLLIAERMTFALADVVISTNQSYKRVAIERGRKDPEDIYVVRSGPRLEKFNRMPPDDTCRNGRRFLVGYLGVMSEFDGVDHLVRAAHHVIRTQGRDEVQFCFIGDGPTRPALIELASELGIADHCEFTGRIDDAAMISALSSCDVCVNPDPSNPLNDKSTMNKILEYMALERPIVQYDMTEGRYSAGAASWYARRDDTSDLALKITGLLDDAPRRKRMGALGRRRMERRFEWAHQVPVLLAAYAKAFLGIPRREHPVLNQAASSAA